MRVELLDIIRDVVTDECMTCGAMLLCLAGQTRRGDLKRIRGSISNKRGAGGENARRNASWQGIEIGIDYRILNLIQP